jgi:hypothetical protein
LKITAGTSSANPSSSAGFPSVHPKIDQSPYSKVRLRSKRRYRKYRVTAQTNSIPGITEEPGYGTPAARMHHATAVHGSQGERDTGMGNRWTRERVTSLRSHHGIAAYNADRRRAEGWLTLTEAADQLHISGITLRLAIERGEIEAEHPLASGPWVINRRALETPKAVRFTERLRRQRRNPVLDLSSQGAIDFSAT